MLVTRDFPAWTVDLVQREKLDQRVRMDYQDFPEQRAAPD